MSDGVDAFVLCFGIVQIAMKWWVCVFRDRGGGEMMRFEEVLAEDLLGCSRILV